MPESILGISAYYHDSAVALVINGQVVAAAQEERFTRIRHDKSFPTNALSYVLDEAGISLEQLTLVVFYEKPFIKFERLLETYHAFAPKGLSSFIKAIPVWIKEKLFMRKQLKDQLKKFGNLSCPLYFSEHHLSHSASAFFPSPFQEAAILTVDGVGEWVTTAISKGLGNKIEIIEEQHFPHSVGLLYSAFTYYAGFQVNSGEYKLMGLAPYGIKDSPQTIEFIKKIREHLVDIKPDGSILLNMSYFNFASGLKMVNERKWEKLFGIKCRSPEAELTQGYMNLACAIQQITDEIVLKLVATAKRLTGCNYLTMAGGVALNCITNSKILESGIFEKVWVQPAAGDAGGALGAALAGWHISLQHSRDVSDTDGMSNAYLGPEFSTKKVKQMADKYDAVYDNFDNFEKLTLRVAGLIDEGKVVGWFQGRMEFGPRALGNRSIIGDARNPKMQKRLNLKIKNRESFRPFAPSVLEEDMQKYFNCSTLSPYMLFVSTVSESQTNTLPSDYEDMPMMERLNVVRSSLPAITHVDFTARIQTVNPHSNPQFYQLISTFKKLTGCSVLVNTSFNVRGEPIVCSPYDAYRCFITTKMDYLVIGDLLFDKKLQPAHLRTVFTKTFKKD